VSLLLCPKCKSYDGWEERTSRRTGRKLRPVRICSDQHEPPRSRCDVCAVEVLLVAPDSRHHYWREPRADWQYHKMSGRSAQACPDCHAELLKAVAVAFDSVCAARGQSRAGQMLGVEPMKEAM
jgi:hypothetical protein